MNRFKSPQGPLGNTNVDPAQRDYSAWNVYPANSLNEWDEGFYFQEHWGAQYRGSFLIAPDPIAVESGVSASQTLTWTYTKSIPLVAGYALLYNGTSVTTDWTPSWTVTVNGVAYPMTLSDIGTITVPAESGSRILLPAPVQGGGTVTWNIALSGSTDISALLWAGLLAW